MSRRLPNPDGPVVKLVIWIGSTLLSIGIVYGSLKARVETLEARDKTVAEKLDEIQKDTSQIPLLKELVLQHMEQDVR